MDEEKLKTIGWWVLRVVVACILISFVWDVIVKQHNFFS